MLTEKILPARVVEPGVYVGRVVVATLASFAWRQSTVNPTGTVVKLGVEVADSQGPAHVFDAADLASFHRIEAIFRSCGLTMPRRVSESLDNLLDRQCEVMTKVIIPRQGKHAHREKSVIGEWLLPGSSGFL